VREQNCVSVYCCIFSTGDCSCKNRVLFPAKSFSSLPQFSFFLTAVIPDPEFVWRLTIGLDFQVKVSILSPVCCQFRVSSCRSLNVR
jgi:hypothetical protein